MKLEELKELAFEYMPGSIAGFFLGLDKIDFNYSSLEEKDLEALCDYMLDRAKSIARNKEGELLGQMLRMRREYESVPARERKEE